MQKFISLWVCLLGEDVLGYNILALYQTMILILTYGTLKLINDSDGRARV